MEDRIRVTFTDLTGSRHADVTLRSNLTMEEIVDRLIQNHFLSLLELGQGYIFYVKGKDVTIQPNQTLGSAGVQEDDVIIVGQVTRGGGWIEVAEVTLDARQFLFPITLPQSRAIIVIAYSFIIVLIGIMILILGKFLLGYLFTTVLTGLISLILTFWVDLKYILKNTPQEIIYGGGNYIIPREIYTGEIKIIQHRCGLCRKPIEAVNERKCPSCGIAFHSKCWIELKAKGRNCPYCGIVHHYPKVSK